MGKFEKDHSNFYRFVISMFNISKILLFFLLFLINSPLFSQKVGVVLSGGGASAVAHVGFLKTLEENNIPIDYIVGTSMGSVIAGLYASGYTPDQMYQLLTSEEFVLMAEGKYTDKNAFYFKQDDPDARWITFKLSKTGKVTDLIPTNLISPVALDLMLMGLYASPEAAANYNFDSLLVPFRCVAADIKEKKEVIFNKGHLTEAIRASATYPFYVKPIKVDGKLLFDGGLYNNFPSDVLYRDFLPDIILGCNVSENGGEPSEDDFLSQLKSMIVRPTNYGIDCENGIIVEPEVNDIGTFNFARTKESYNIGYNATQEKIEQIKSSIQRRVSDEEIALKRKVFKSKFKPVEFHDIFIEGLNKNQSIYVKRSLIKKNRILSFTNLKKNYSKIFSDDKIADIYPKSYYNTEENGFDLFLKIKKEKNFMVGLGGSFASRPVGSGMLAVKYNYLGIISSSFNGNFYFGKFYNSAMLKSRIDIPIRLPFFIEPEANISKTDYFKSKSFFYTDERPSYFVQNELYGKINLGIPLSKKGKLRIGYSFGKLIDEYYQAQSFTKLDTADQTFFNFVSPYLLLERSTLNGKQYANAGSYTYFSARFVQGQEFNVPGSTSISKENFSKFHQWAQFRFLYENYYKQRGRIHLGLFLEGYYSSQGLFNNYTISSLRAKSFRSTTESNTLFLESFRANKYLAFGHRIIFELMSNMELRFEGYVFQPYQRIIEAEDKTVTLGAPFDKRYVVGSANLVIKTPVGPISFATNYYHNVPEVANEKKTPLTFFFHFGYILFNRKALE